MTATPWYIEAFRADYLDVYAHRDEDAAAEEARGALALLGHAPGGRLLDLAAGAGRHARAFQAAGCAVTCLDLSADLAARCAARGLATVRADMRALPLRDGVFRSVACLFSSFGYFQEEAEHRCTLQEMARVLAPGGAALLDLMDPDTVRLTLVPRSDQTLGDGRLAVSRRLVQDGRRVEKHLTLRRPGRPDRAWHESVRLFTHREVRGLAADSGLALEQVVGDYDGRPHRAGETRQLIVLRKTP